MLNGKLIAEGGGGELAPYSLPLDPPLHTKLGEKLRSSSVPEFAIFVCKYRVPFLVATPTGLVAMVTNLVLN